MYRNSMPEIPSPAEDNGDLSYHAIRCTPNLPVKRNAHAESNRTEDRDRRSERRWRPRSHLFRSGRRGVSIKGSSLFYGAVFAAVFLFVVAATFLQSSQTWSNGQKEINPRRELMLGNVLRFVPFRVWERFRKHGGLDRLRSDVRVAVRKPRLALVLGSMKRDPQSLMLLTVAKSLKGLGYVLKVYAMEDGEAHSFWKQVGYQPSILGLESIGHVDWSIFEGIILSSLEAECAMSSLMQEPFSSIPVIWVIQEDTLAKRLPVYMLLGWEDLIMKWRSAFMRADVVVFPDFTLPMLHVALDSGNFFVISGSPVDVWAAETYQMAHSKYQLRSISGFNEDDLLILIIGSSLFYNELPWDYAVAMHAIGPLLMKLMRTKGIEGSFKFVFLCGNSTDAYRDALQDIASRLGFPDGSVRHYGMDSDVNGVLLMADIVLYGSFQEEQGFPPLLIRAMSFEIPIIAPDLAIIKKYVVDGVHGLIFRARNPETLTRVFSLLLSDMKLSKFAYLVASSGKLLARDLLALECITGYANLLEDVLQFPSDTILPGSTSQIQQNTWEWALFNEMDLFDQTSDSTQKSSIVYALEEELSGGMGMRNASENETMKEDRPTKLDWNDVKEMEITEEFERLEMEQIEERMEKNYGSWDEIYRNARKAEKLKSEANERDEGELERTGQPLCIYEVYSGPGAWPFLHHGSLYRGLSLSIRGRRPRSDDVDAVGRLQVLNDTYYRDLLCEMGGMFSVARQVDNIHKIPWIGFQSWRAAGRQVSLSIQAEKVLEDATQSETKGDVIYYWAKLDMYPTVTEARENRNFWSICDILNGGHCRAVFEDTFLEMYGLPLELEALPPMPDDGGYWSSMHSWAMPTPSFLEFIMFSRMFADSLDKVTHNSSNGNTCLLGSSEVERKHCYCRILELLVNVWAYHSARKMVYINPSSGSLEEQHPMELRQGLMWVKYFNSTLLKSMDEDLAEEADDGDHLTERWLWPLTGEVHWQGIYEREREERYRIKMDKKRKTKEKLLERQRYGYRQKTLAGG